MEIIKMKNNKATSSKEKKEEVPTTPCQGPKTQLLLFLRQWFFLVLLPSFASAACDQVDHEALLSLASKVSSSPPLNWSASTNCCLWEGILCNQDDQRVIRASLPGRGLNGVISPYITNLTYLTHLNLAWNSLSGPLPDDLFSSLSSNGNNYTSLTILDLSFNKFTGLVPPGLGACFKLQVFRTGFNYLSGSLPDDIYDAANLQELSLPVNHISGVISDDITRLKNLKILWLTSNQFSGPIPSHIVSTTGDHSAFNFSTLQHLTKLDLGNNNFTGELSQSLYSCKSLTAIRLAKSDHSEPLPDYDNIVEPDGFHNLQLLALEGCQFAGQLPTWLANLKNLQVLDLAFNLITGGLPNMLCGLPVLTPKEAVDQVERGYLEMPIFVMSSNANNQKYKQLSKLPPAIYLGSNNISGKIPIEIGQLKFVHYLDLSHNNFSGRIPDQISNLTNLERLDLSHNHLSGEIPASLKGLNFLSFFSVPYNDLQGLVPTGSQFDTLPPPALKEIQAYVALQLRTALALKAFKAFHQYIQLRRDITGRSCLLQLSL
ncbi:PREDICTED: receptor [Prunus dulcis]|uniref:PREDICTED: receptor n=1 Tax=Prunus dulcis TaxID=3755 RepID=A0A5E4GKS9_PRUDU|nr:PREDICTED: receptor [Prunus dulcis]